MVPAAPLNLFSMLSIAMARNPLTLSNAEKKELRREPQVPHLFGLVFPLGMGGWGLTPEDTAPLTFYKTMISGISLVARPASSFIFF